MKVPVGDSDGPPTTYWYCDPSYANGHVCETKVNVGDTVQWNWVDTAPHTVTACGTSCNQPTNSPLFSSGVHTQGGQYQFTFNTPGTYPYYCTVHGTAQMGRIVVTGPGGGTPHRPERRSRRPRSVAQATATVAALSIRSTLLWCCN